MGSVMLGEAPASMMASDQRTAVSREISHRRRTTAGSRRTKRARVSAPTKNEDVVNGPVTAAVTATSPPRSSTTRDTASRWMGKHPSFPGSAGDKRSTSLLLPIAGS